MTTINAAALSGTTRAVQMSFSPNPDRLQEMRSKRTRKPYTAMAWANVNRRLEAAAETETKKSA